MDRILVTGGAGFIGCNFVRYMLKKYPGIHISVLDKLTYAGRLENLKDLMKDIKFIKGDICNEEDVKKAVEDCDTIFNFAAETHVDNSIKNPKVFVQTNVFGVINLLETSREFDIKKFIQISTDEVYGSTTKDSFSVGDSLNPSSPYSASKAGGEMIVKAYNKTYGLNTIVTRSSNNYGPFQFLEKFIPLLITNCIKNKNLPIYGDGKNIRDWLFVLDNCEAIDLIFKKGEAGKIYNVGSNNEIKNIEVAKTILKHLKKPEKLVKFVKDRPGHDFRYSLDFTETKNIGWFPKTSFDDGIEKTINWYVENEWWWK